MAELQTIHNIDKLYIYNNKNYIYIYINAILKKKKRKLLINMTYDKTVFASFCLDSR